MALTMQEGRLRSRVVEQLGLVPGPGVLEVGCGTGSPAIRIPQAEPRARVVGVDPDVPALRIAARKASTAGARLRFDPGNAQRLPYGDATFDRVVFSLVLHHLDRRGKKQALTEALRVRRPGGTLHIADLAPARSRLGRFALLPIRLLDGFERLSDNVEGRRPEFVQAAGFRLFPEPAHHLTVFGPLGFLDGGTTY